MKKPSFDENRVMLGEVLPISTPFRLTLDASEACNLKCNYCFRCTETSENWGYAQKREIMKPEVFRIAIKQIDEFAEQPKVISVSGMGEPLCNPDIAKIIAVAKETCPKSKVEIHTNALLLENVGITEFARSGADKIVVSLQGLNSATYKQVCGADIDFEVFIEGLKKLFERKLPSCELNIKIIDKAISNMEEEQKFYSTFEPIANRVFIEKSMALWQGQIDYLPEENTATNKFGANLGEINCCAITFLSLTVAPDGEIYPCCVINPPFSLGNVKNTTLASAWNSIRRKEFLRDTLKRGRDAHPNCKNCYFPKGYAKTNYDVIDEYAEQILERL